jgi:predicted dehydrogenase
MAVYRAAIVGCGRMGGTIDDEMLTRRYPPIFTLPRSHAAAYAALPQTELVAIADVDPTKLASFGERWQVAPAHRYTDYRAMIQVERPDLVSVTTRSPLHAEITVFAASHGVRGIYCEKAMCCSLAEADAMVEAVEGHGVQFNLGTFRRWQGFTDQVLAMIAEGRLGRVRTVISYGGGSLLHTGSHWTDLLLCLAGDPAVEFVQGQVEAGDRWDGRSARIEHDLDGTGFIQFAGGIRGYYLSGGPSGEFEIIGSEGTVRIMNDGFDWHLRHVRQRPNWARRTFDEVPLPPMERPSCTVRIVEDLLQAMESSGTTRGNVHVARTGMEIQLGFVESHRQGGARVPVPVANRELYMTSV